MRGKSNHRDVTVRTAPLAVMCRSDWKSAIQSPPSGSAAIDLMLQKPGPCRRAVPGVKQLCRVTTCHRGHRAGDQIDSPDRGRLGDVQALSVGRERQAGDVAEPRICHGAVRAPAVGRGVVGGVELPGSPATVVVCPSAASRRTAHDRAMNTPCPGPPSIGELRVPIGHAGPRAAGAEQSDALVGPDPRCARPVHGERLHVRRKGMMVVTRPSDLEQAKHVGLTRESGHVTQQGARAYGLEACGIAEAGTLGDAVTLPCLRADIGRDPVACRIQVSDETPRRCLDGHGALDVQRHAIAVDRAARRPTGLGADVRPQL